MQKYGGTSVNTKENRAKLIANVRSAKEEGYSTVVVVSAMGRSPEPYATDSLLALLPDAASAPARSIDMLSSLGENITTVIVSEELRLSGIAARPLSGAQAGILTDENFSEGNIRRIDTDKLLSLLAEGIVPIVAGFQGMSEQGEILTLGRGGSDITACALGGALKAERIEIYSDVDGVLSADPRIAPTAQLLEAITYENAFALADYGAKVIHPRAVKFAQAAGVPIASLHVQKGRRSRCTIISDNADKENFAAVTSKNGFEKAGEPASRIAVLGEATCSGCAEAKLKAALNEQSIPLLEINTTAAVIFAYVPEASAPAAVDAIHKALIG